MKKQQLKTLALKKKAISNLSSAVQGGGDRYITDPIMCGGTVTCHTNCDQATCGAYTDDCGGGSGRNCFSVPAAFTCQIC